MQERADGLRRTGLRHRDKNDFINEHRGIRPEQFGQPFRHQAAVAVSDNRDFMRFRCCGEMFQFLDDVGRRCCGKI